MLPDGITKGSKRAQRKIKKAPNANKKGPKLFRTVAFLLFTFIYSLLYLLMNRVKKSRPAKSQRVTQKAHNG